MSTPSPPFWPHCGQDADSATDPVGCRGIHVPGHTKCLAHLTDADRTAYLTDLTSGADIDHRGTFFTHDLLRALFNALRDPMTNSPHVGSARFEGAWFAGPAEFDRAQFSGLTRFQGARFSGPAWFQGARFSGPAWFEGVQFSGPAWFKGAQFSDSAVFQWAQFSDSAEFEEAQFSGHTKFQEAQFSNTAEFEKAQFSGHTRFERAQFAGPAAFGRAQFSGPVWFERVRFSNTAAFDMAQFSDRAMFQGAQFAGPTGFDRVQFSGPAGFQEARFSNTAGFQEAQFSNTAGFQGAHFSDTAGFQGAQFEGTSVLGPLTCAGRVVLSGSVFVLPVTLEIAARELVCERTRWESTVTVRVRYAAVDLSHAVLTAPAAVITHPTPFVHNDTAVSETLLANPGPQQSISERVRVVSVQGVDAAHLVLTDTDLADCLFSGAFHLDEIRLEGRTTFAGPPSGWHRRGLRPIHFTRRRVLAEEHHWRAHAAGPGPHGWRPGPHPTDPARIPDPEDVSALYRQLRKALEDGKNEPGAADFYYGECEMRRHDPTGTAKGERRLLWAYWLLSGYGLRASRAFTWLLAAMSLTVLLLMGFGLPTHDPAPATAGTLHGDRISLRTTTPSSALRGGWNERFTAVRVERASRVAINSVVFRSSGQNLTTVGTYIEMTSRLLEPILLALGVLAIRGRIKR